MNVSHSFKSGWILLAVFLFLGVVPFSIGLAQEGDKKPKIPEPEAMTLTTDDGVLMRCTFYAPIKGNGKKTVPIILLHDWDGRGSDYSALAETLQKSGHAVMVPDLRGHGNSVNYVAGEKEIDRKRIKPPLLISRMASKDIEALKKFLMKKNNAGELNIELLCVVGAGMSCPLALNWIVQDWSWPKLPGIKQGQDVKAAVLLSPPRTFQGYHANNALKHPFIRGNYGNKNQLSLMILVGSRNSRASSDAKRLNTSLKRYYPDLKGKPVAERLKSQSLFYETVNTRLQGTKLVDPLLGKGVVQKIETFIRLRLVNKVDNYGWSNRSKAQ